MCKNAGKIDCQISKSIQLLGEGSRSFTLKPPGRVQDTALKRNRFFIFGVPFFFCANMVTLLLSE